MAMIEGIDYVFAPKATLVIGGVVMASCLGTKNYLFLIPKEKISGAGRNITTEKFSIGELDTIEGIKTIADSEDITVEVLENKVLQLIEEWGIEKDKYVVEISQLFEFDIKNGLLSCGIYYKKQNQKMRSTVAISGKEQVNKFKEFYGK